jgi:hypothetical protein
VGQGPGLAGVALAQVAAQRVHPVGVWAGHGSQSATGPDGGQLARVAHDDGLGAGPVDVVQEGGEFEVTGHACLVQDDHGAVIEAQLAVVETPQQRSDCAGRHAGAPSQDLGRLACGGGAQQPPPGGLVGVTDRGQHAGLAGTGFGPDLAPRP